MNSNEIFNILNIKVFTLLSSSILGSFLFSFIFSLFFGYIIINIFKKYKINEMIKSYTPPLHLKKINIPTMGGIIIIISLTFSILMFSNLSNTYNIYLLFLLLCYGMIGFIDDYLKLFGKKKKD